MPANVGPQTILECAYPLYKPLRASVWTRAAVTASQCRRGHLRGKLYTRSSSRYRRTPSNKKQIDVASFHGSCRIAAAGMLVTAAGLQHCRLPGAVLHTTLKASGVCVPLVPFPSCGRAGVVSRLLMGFFFWAIGYAAMVPRVHVHFHEYASWAGN